MRLSVLRLSLLAWVAASACAPSLSTMQPAHVAPKGHVQAAGGFDIGVPTGTLLDVIDAGETLGQAAADGRDLTTAEKQQLFDAGVAFAVLRPSFSPLLQIAYTAVDRLELNLRYAGEGWRIGTRYQVLDHVTGPFDLVVGLGAARASKSVPVDDLIPVLKIDEFSRTTVDVPVLVGTSRDFLRVWLGPRFLYTRVSTSLRLELSGQPAEVARFTAGGLMVGAQGGIALGWKRLFVAFELTIVHHNGNARAEVLPATYPMGRTVDVDSLIVHPTVGIIGEF